MNHRYLMMLRLLLIRSPMKRVEYMKKHGVFHSVGDRVMITSRKIPLYAKLISIGSNVWMASGVTFVTHDILHFMLNGTLSKGQEKFQEKAGCIEIGNNVFIGANVQILYDVRIGNNVMIAAGAIVNRDIPDNSVAAGIPARVIGSLDSLMEKRRAVKVVHPVDNARQYVSPQCEAELWSAFYQSRGEEPPSQTAKG